MQRSFVFKYKFSIRLLTKKALIATAYIPIHPDVQQSTAAEATFSLHFVLVLIIESQNHRMAWVEKNHNGHLVTPSCYVQGRQPLDQAAQSHIQPGLECLQGWGIHNLLGQPVPVRHHPLSEKLPPNI